MRINDNLEIYPLIESKISRASDLYSSRYLTIKF